MGTGEILATGAALIKPCIIQPAAAPAANSIATCIICFWSTSSPLVRAETLGHAGPVAATALALESTGFHPALPHFQIRVEASCHG